MYTITQALQNILDSETTKLTVCWFVEKGVGSPTEVIRGTAHDKDITISSGDYAGTYRAGTAVMASDIESQSDGGVQNLEVEGAFQVDANIPDLTVADIEGGSFDQATAVLLLVDWSNPNAGQKVLLSGTLGEFFRDSDGRYRTEVRGLTQALQQNVMRTYGERCDVKLFGDSRCGFDVAGATRTGTILSVTSRKRFTVALSTSPTLTEPALAYYVGGRLLFVDGNNQGVYREIRAHSEPGSPQQIDILLWDEAPDVISASPGDTVSIEPGCDRLYATCKHVHNNLVNFRGHGFLATGKDRLMAGRLSATSTTLIQADGNLVITEAEYDALRAAFAASIQALLT